MPPVAFPGQLPVHMQIPGYVVTCHSGFEVTLFNVLATCMHYGLTLSDTD